MKYQIISERKEKYNVKVSYPSDLCPSLKRYAYLEKEHFYICTLDGGHNVIAIHLISMGILNKTLIHPREIFKPAILDMSASIIMVHNHPSGNMEPSEEDKVVTQRLADAGNLMGIKVIDHMIISKNGYYSFCESGNSSLEPNKGF